jgi:hypothetical protein
MKDRRMPKKSPFQKRLDEKMRAKRRAASSKSKRAPVEAPAVELSAEDLAAAGDIHPLRYPEHKTNPLKGQVYKGECNRTACHNRNAIWWNIHTFGLYCSNCGPRMNFSDSAICAPVRNKPTLAEMNDPEFKASVQKKALKSRPSVL